MGIIRVLADDGSIHQFPDNTDPNVISNALARYHAGNQNGSPIQGTSSFTNSRVQFGRPASPPAQPSPQPNSFQITDRQFDEPPLLGTPARHPAPVSDTWRPYLSASYPTPTIQSQFTPRNHHLDFWQMMVPAASPTQEMIADLEDDDYQNAGLNYARSIADPFFMRGLVNSDCRRSSRGGTERKAEHKCAGDRGCTAITRTHFRSDTGRGWRRRRRQLYRRRSQCRIGIVRSRSSERLRERHREDCSNLAATVGVRRAAGFAR